MIFLAGQRLNIGCRGRGAKTGWGWYGIECSAASRKRTVLHENLALNFHQRRVAMSVSDISCLCTKITFSTFED
ncbi:hypothetical protein MA884_17695 [Pseudomonas sp. Q11]|nr:hypothetical protein [Pseudomonas sp. Q11]